jgi:hypothetical protein
MFGVRIWCLAGAAACFIAGACLDNSAARGGQPVSSSSGVIFGHVLSGQGTISPLQPQHFTPLPGAKVTISDVHGHAVLAAATADADGGFSFTVPAGNYMVRGVGNPALVHVDPGQKVQVDLYVPNP